MMKRTALASALLPLTLCLMGSECKESEEDEDFQYPEREVDRSDVAPTEDQSAWASSPWQIDDPARQGLIEIEPGTGIKLYHNLGRVPVDVQAYVGFAEDAKRVMAASGNAVEIREVTGEYVQIRNGSGGSFFYRFVLR